MDDKTISPLETIELARVSEYEHQELDRMVLNDPFLSFPLKFPGIHIYTRLLSVIISTCRSRKSGDLDINYEYESEAKRLVEGNADLLGELKHAWEIGRFARIRSLKILQRDRSQDCKPKLPGVRRWITITLIRHGESVSNVTQEHQLPEGTLTKCGEKQAEKLGQRWSNVHIDHFFSSSFKRAHMTAQAIARHNPQAPAIQTDYMLVEQDVGEAVRRTPRWKKDTVFELMAGKSRYDTMTPLSRDYRPPDGGESYNDVAARAKYFLRSVLNYGVEIDPEPVRSANRDKPLPERFDERTPHVVVVSHGIFLLELYESILFYNAPETRRNVYINFDNTDMVRFTLGLDISNFDEPLRIIKVVEYPT